MRGGTGWATEVVSDSGLVQLRQLTDRKLRNSCIRCCAPREKLLAGGLTLCSLASDLVAIKNFESGQLNRKFSGFRCRRLFLPRGTFSTARALTVNLGAGKIQRIPYGLLTQFGPELKYSFVSCSGVPPGTKGEFNVKDLSVS